MDNGNVESLQDDNGMQPGSVIYIKEEPPDDIFLCENDIKQEVFVNKVIPRKLPTNLQKRNDYIKTEPSSSTGYLSIRTDADPYLSVLPTVNRKSKHAPYKKVYTIKQSQIRRRTRTRPISQDTDKEFLKEMSERLECAKCEIDFPNIEMLMKHGQEHIIEKFGTMPRFPLKKPFM